jgi:hypothetical protein
MKNRELKKQLQRESRLFVPDIRGKLFEELNLPNISETREKPSFRLTFRPAFLFSLALVMLIAIGISLSDRGFQPTYITVDINPSIEIQADEMGNIVSYRPLNVDAALLLEDYVFENDNVTEMIKSIITLAEENGYLSEDNQNQVHISAYNENTQKEEKINREIKDYFQYRSDVIVKEIAASIREKARTYRISPHKMELIESILQENSEADIDDMKKKSVPELNQILRGYSEEEIRRFRNGYSHKQEELENARENGLSQLHARYSEKINQISEIRNQISDEVPLATIAALILEYFPEYASEDFSQYDYDKYSALMVKIEQTTNAQMESIRQLIEDKYIAQMKSFRGKLQDEIHSHIPYSFDFDFDLDFSMDEYEENNNSGNEEIELLELVAKMEIRMELQPISPRIRRNNDREIEELKEQYNETIISDKVSDAFRNSELIQRFQKKYDEYKENIKK